MAMTKARLALAAAVFACSAVSNPSAAAPFMVLGLDQKQLWNDAGERVLFPAGNDLVAILDLAEPETPRIIGALPLENSVAGPPVNVAISPDNRFALVADSYTVEPKDNGLAIVPTDKLFVIDLASKKPQLVQTLSIGKQPSGLSINPAGTLALVGYRADNAVGVLKIESGRVREIARIPLGDSISHVAFSPDGRRALAVHHDSAKLSVLDIVGDKVSFNGVQVQTTAGVYVAEVTPNGHLALTIDKQFVSVIDMQAQSPRLLDRVAVSPGGEGLAISPRGDVAVSVSLRGSNGDKRSAPFHERGAIDVLGIQDGKVTHLKTIEVGRIPEAAGFSPDGRFLYVGNFLDNNVWVFRVEGTELIDTGKRITLPGRPASGRVSSVQARSTGVAQ